MYDIFKFDQYQQFMTWIIISLMFICLLLVVVKNIYLKVYDKKAMWFQPWMFQHRTFLTLLDLCKPQNSISIISMLLRLSQMVFHHILSVLYIICKSNVLNLIVWNTVEYYFLLIKCWKIVLKFVYSIEIIFFMKLNRESVIFLISFL